MKQGRETTLNERIEIVKECIVCGKNYGKMALKYQVSYQQVRTWTLRFEAMGETGLEDRRGKRKKSQTPRTELEQAQIEIEQLKHKLYLAEIELHTISRQNLAIARKADALAHTDHGGRGDEGLSRPFFCPAGSAGAYVQIPQIPCGTVVLFHEFPPNPAKAPTFRNNVPQRLEVIDTKRFSRYDVANGVHKQFIIGRGDRARLSRPHRKGAKHELRFEQNDHRDPQPQHHEFGHHDPP